MTRLAWSRRVPVPTPSLPTPRLHLALLDGVSFSRLAVGTPLTPYALPAVAPVANPLEQLRSGLDANYTCFSTARGCTARTARFATEKQRPLFSRVNTVFKPHPVVSAPLRKPRTPRLTAPKVSFVCGRPSAVLSPSSGGGGASRSPPWEKQDVEVEDAVGVWSEWDVPARKPGPELKKVSFVGYGRSGNAVTPPLKRMPLWSASEFVEKDDASMSSLGTMFDTEISEFGSVLHAVRKISRKLSGGKEEVEDGNIWAGNQKTVALLDDDFISFACAQEADIGQGRFRGVLTKVVSRF